MDRVHIYVMLKGVGYLFSKFDCALHLVFVFVQEAYAKQRLTSACRFHVNIWAIALMTSIDTIANVSVAIQVGQFSIKDIEL